MLILKIAAGVFIGCLAAFLVLSEPGWFERRQQRQRTRDAASLFRSLTEEDVVARCGKPRGQESFSPDAKGEAGRRSLYQSSNGLMVEVWFSNSPDDPTFRATFATDVSEENFRKELSPAQAIEWLPCLSGE